LQGAEDVARYLVALALANQWRVIRVLHMYYVENYSPSVIESVLNIPRSSVRGYVQRINTRVGSQRAHVLLRQLIPKLKTVSPVVNGDKCMLCNRPVDNMPIAAHIILFHKDLVDKATHSILNRVERVERAPAADK